MSHALPGRRIYHQGRGEPADVRTLAWGGLTIWLFVLWVWWCDRRREPAG
ncbi:MAG TPA: hypothetical protein VN999_06625 [Thermoanaerobaculia bacterium]|nr:hypothetical protein [Thermoanaerobaculia bacterium]